MNRIIAGIERAKVRITERLNGGLVTQSKLEETHKAMDMDITEYCRFQEIKSLASVDGRLTLDEAQTVYAYLGNTPETFNEQPLEVKWVLTEVFANLLKRQVGR